MLGEDDMERTMLRLLAVVGRAIPWTIWEPKDATRGSWPYY